MISNNMQRLSEILGFFWANKKFAVSCLYIILFFLMGILGYFLPEPKTSNIREAQTMHPSFGRSAFVLSGSRGINTVSANYKPKIGEEFIKNEYGKVITTGPHFFGTDNYGRDLAIMLLIGTKSYLIPACMAVLISMFIGTPLGILSSDIWDRFWLKIASQSIMDTLEAMPKYITILLAIIIIPINSRNFHIWIFPWYQFYWLSIILGFLNVPKVGKFILQKVNALEKREFIESAISMGFSRFKISVKHVLWYNCLPLLITQATLLITEIIFIEVTLSYLGAESKIWGLDVTNGWGSYLVIGRSYFLQKTGWWLTFFPLLAIVLTVFMVNLFSSSLIELLEKERTSAEFRGKKTNA